MRKKWDEAVYDIADTVGTRLEFLKRNPDFVGDIKSYNDLARSTRQQLATRQKEADRLKTKWKLPFILPITSSVDFDRVWTPVPVKIVRMSEPSLADELQAKRNIHIFTEDELAGRFITLRIDTRATIEDLMPVIEKILRDVYRAKRVDKQRRRPTEAAVQLKVYDLAAAGETFAVIARKVRRPVSTVKSSYLAATAKIFGENQPLETARLAGFSPEQHTSTCEICNKATNVKELCNQARSYINKDQKGQRERTGYSTTGASRLESDDT